MNEDKYFKVKVKLVQEVEFYITGDMYDVDKPVTTKMIEESEMQSVVADPTYFYMWMDYNETPTVKAEEATKEDFDRWNKKTEGFYNND